MTTRSSLNILTQIGVEDPNAKGTPVACGTKLPGLEIDLTPTTVTKFYRSSGKKYFSTGVLHKTSSKGTYKGPLSFTESVYVFSSYVNSADPSAIGTTTAEQWDFLPNDTGPDNTKTITVQRGDATLAKQTAYVQFNSVQVKITRDTAEINGNLLGQAMDDGASMTASPTEIAQVPISGNKIDLYIDSTFGGIGTTNYGSPYEVNINLPDKYKENWVLNSGQASWKDLVEAATEPLLDILIEYNAQAQALYLAMKANNLPTYYLRVKCTGPAIGSSGYLWQGDFAIKFKGADEVKDKDGVYAYKFMFEIVDDATMGRPYSFRVINKLTTL